MEIDTIRLLKAELDMHNIPDGRYEQLHQLLDVAASRLEEKGITLDKTDAGDVHLQVEYAAWLYRRRRQEASKMMPEYLRLDIHDRLISEKARITDGKS